tara:strand:+ start:2109 stop:2279 length:171 start_codon:yes stop_codon:yes gene_type:complete
MDRVVAGVRAGLIGVVAAAVDGVEAGSGGRGGKLGGKTGCDTTPEISCYQDAEKRP